jgi:hypothetical protein
MQNSNNFTPIKLFPLIDREFEEVEGGYYDNNGFYFTPNGSFWDENGTYFNSEGLDKHGGTFDEYGMYIPGSGWNDDLCCYEENIDDNVDRNALAQAINEKFHQELIDEYDYYKQFFNNPEHSQLNNFEEVVPFRGLGNEMSPSKIQNQEDMK